MVTFSLLVFPFLFYHKLRRYQASRGYIFGKLRLKTQKTKTLTNWS